MFRWGVLSTAKIAREQMLPAIADSTNGTLSAIAARDPDDAREVAERFAIPHALATYEDVFASDQVDGVYLPVPTSRHTEWTLKAAKAGKHVLCEKPIAMQAGDIDEIIAARDAYGVLICEAFMVFYHPQWHMVSELIADGAIGRLRHVQGVFSYFNADPTSTRNRLDMGGGGLRDIGVYPVVTTRIITGEEPRRVQATVERDADFGTDAYASVRADFGDFELSFYCSTQLALRQVMVFHGERGFIEVEAPFNAGDYDHHRITLHDQGHQRAEVFRFPATRQYRLEAEAFAGAATGRGDAVFTLEDSRKNQQVIDAIFRAGEHDGWMDV
ncbi:MAG: Gfo/Idh/MocA family oxidoreductase [Caulobacterales bacterium]|nr:Gfo/Idh/MocA family oxidoreductase [Caulobacterales bacterium]